MSSTSNANIPLDYNPFVQNFTLIQGDGQPILIPMAEVDHFRLYGVRLAINYGSQIGASAILLLVLLLLTKSEKRRSWIFIMNALCLFLNTVRSILQCTWLTGNQYNIYSQLTGDATHDTWHDHANTVASNTMTLLLVICVMVSLSMQVWVVCITTPMIQRIIIMVTTSIIALIAIGYRFAVAAISNALVFSNGDMYSRRNLLVMMTIFQAVAIWAYCVVFMFKLGYALIQRRKLGMTQFGPMQIIFIMGAQTMFIPAVFSILQFYDAVPELGSWTLTAVCIFLPLSAIWAGVITGDSNIASHGANSHQRLLAGQFGRTPPNSTSNSRTGHSKGSNVASTLGKDPDSPGAYYKEKDSTDGGIQVHVDREFTIEDGKPSAVNAYNNV